MKQPNWVVEFPPRTTAEQWAAIEAEIDILRGAPGNPIAVGRLTELGATIRRIPYKPQKPRRPALVRRAMALHR